MKSRHHSWACVVFSILLFIPWASGCGNSGLAQGVPVQGIVTLDGEPLETGSITFANADGGAAAVGEIVKGHYSLSQTAGAAGIPPNKYTVLVYAWKVKPGEVQADGSFSMGESLIPPKYSDLKKTDLSADVAKGGGTFNFDLTSK